MKTELDKPESISGLKVTRCTRQWIDGNGYQAFCEVVGCGKPTDNYYDITCGPLGDFLFYCDDPAHKAAVCAEGERMDAERRARDAAAASALSSDTRSSLAKPDSGTLEQELRGVADAWQDSSEVRRVCLRAADFLARSVVARVERGEAVNLARQIKDRDACVAVKPVISEKGIDMLADAVLRMDAALLAPAATAMPDSGFTPIQQLDSPTPRTEALRHEADIATMGERHFKVLGKVLDSHDQLERELAEAVRLKRGYAEACIANANTTHSGDVHGINIPRDLHPRTANLVLRFATALANKLHSAEKKYGYDDGWAMNDWMEECQQRLAEHVQKGDPRDVAAYCAFMWHHAWSTKAQSASALKEITCPACKGSGDVKSMTSGRGPDDEQVDVQCEMCGGVGAIASPNETSSKEILDTPPTSGCSEYVRGLEDAARLCEGKGGVWPFDEDGYRDTEWGERYARCIRDLNPEPQRG